MLFSNQGLHLHILLVFLQKIHFNNAFCIHNDINNRPKSKQNMQLLRASSSSLNDIEFKINGETTTTTSLPQTISSETIQNDALSQFEQAMEYFMFELGNDIVFLSNPSEVSNYITNNFETILFDCDGVLYKNGNVMIPFCKEALQYLIQNDKKIFFVTNNSENSRIELKDKLNNILWNDHGEEEGGDGDERLVLTAEQMITSSYAASKYLQQTLCHDKSKSSQECNIIVIGSNGLCNEIQNVGFNVKALSSLSILSESSDSSSMNRADLASYTFEQEENFDNDNNGIDAIVVGLDTDFTYRKLCIVTALLNRHPNALFIATNEDAFDVVNGDSNSSMESNDKRNLPGNGSIVKSIEVSSQRKAINVGKPSKILVDLLQKEYKFDIGRTLMVGDRLDTDVKFGKDGGMKSALVLTGCTDVDKLMEVGVGTDEEPLPHIIIPHMGMMKGS